MRDFTVLDQHGDQFRLDDELARGAVVVVFLRGDW